MIRRKICVLGGTGAEGAGLALRWANAGHDVIIGSRDAAKASIMADELNRSLARKALAGMESALGVEQSDIAVLAVPYSAQLSTIEGLRHVLAGKILIDVTVPLVPPKVSRVQLPAADSCVVGIQEVLGSTVQVVSAFQNVSAHKLKKLDAVIECDVLVTSDYVDARKVGIELANDAGLRGIDAGPLANSVVAESLTSVLIHINRHYKIPDAGLKISGLALDPAV
jgi:NADPH-dependent F420 reductase